MCTTAGHGAGDAGVGRTTSGVSAAICLRAGYGAGDAGVGLVDVGCGHPGTVQSEFSSEVFRGWAPEFYERLQAHVQGAAATRYGDLIDFIFTHTHTHTERERERERAGGLLVKAS